MFYDPSLTYLPPVYFNGSSYPAANFTSAWQDGYASSGGPTDLSDITKLSTPSITLATTGPTVTDTAVTGPINVWKEGRQRLQRLALEHVQRLGPQHERGRHDRDEDDGREDV